MNLFSEFGKLKNQTTQILSRIINICLALNVSFAELGAKMPFSWKIQNLMKLERFEGFFPHSIPNVLKHWSLYKKTIQLDRLKFATARTVTDIFQKIPIVKKPQSINRFQRTSYERKGRVCFKCTRSLIGRIISWNTEAWIFQSFNTHTHTHTHTPGYFFWITFLDVSTFHIILSVIT